ncbi:MAG: peptidoglycan bridge formation glycyltransferase FemA/FemB family protein [Candidatus Doudnabacteria bacterium]|nr:peptidoglycan bridge formation glycyltransferase FemA/FemB family protein [Candidatus Doudnabacteria bacterium]
MISNLSQEAWDTKVIELSGSILQSWVWGEFQQSLGQKIFRFSDETSASLAIETALPMGKKYLYCPRGPLGDPQSALADLKKLSEDHSVVFARVEPQVKLDLPASPKETQPSHNWMLSLDKEEEELLMRMKPKTRYNINLAQRKGVMVREGSKPDLIMLYKLFLETAARNKFKLHPQNYYWQMFETLAPNCLKILVAEYKRQPLAGMILTVFSDTATYLHGGSSHQMKEAMAPYLLHWEAIKLAKRAGFTTYDFGGINSFGSWAGITRFKKSFGGYEVNYPGSYDLVFSPIWYNVYKNARLLRKILTTH